MCIGRRRARVPCFLRGERWWSRDGQLQLEKRRGVVAWLGFRRPSKRRQAEAFARAPSWRVRAPKCPLGSAYV